MFWGGGILVYRTYALYQSEKNYNVIKGIVPDFGYDVKLAIEVDGKKENNVPTRGLYKTNIVCNNEVVGSWDYNAWNLKLDNLKKDTKCTIEFKTNGISKEQYDEYISEGVSLRRNTYRGKDITNYKSLSDDEEMNLFNQIKNCTFDDIYVGDYIVSDTTAEYNNKNVIWLIADLNNYLYSGDNALETCHATIIPATPLYNAKMNDTATTGVVDEILNKGAYYGSNMRQKVLPSVLENYIKPTFDGHVIKTRNLLADVMDPNRSNQWGLTTGASSGWAWYDSELDLMSEVNVYGSTVWSSSGYDIGIDNRQYAIFKLKPEFINSYGDKRFNYWLKAVADSTDFAVVGVDGIATTSFASNSLGVRPRFLIS